MKRSLIFLLLISLILLQSACVNNSDTSLTDADNKINIYTTLYVTAYFSQKIGGDMVSVINIIPPGVGDHDYEPTAKDMAKLLDADIFIYNGAQFEGWVDKVIKNLDENKVKVVNASQNIALIETSHNHNEESEEQHTDEEHIMDPHVWLDPLRAIQQAQEIKNALVKLDPENANIYETNFQQLQEKLIELDQKYVEELKNVNRKEFFVSHAAFGYLAERYGLNQISLSGIIPADEPSPAELAEIISHGKELNIKYILLDPYDLTKISEVVADEIGAELAYINTIGSLSNENIAQGKDYFMLMEENLVVLKKALNE